MLYQIIVGLLVLVLVISLSIMQALHHRQLKQERSTMYQWLIGSSVEAATEIESCVRMSTSDGSDLYAKRLVPEGMKGKVLFAWYDMTTKDWVIKVCWQDHFAFGETHLSSVRPAAL